MSNLVEQNNLFDSHTKYQELRNKNFKRKWFTFSELFKYTLSYLF